MNGWIVAYLVLNFMGLGVILAKHGEPSEINFWRSLFAFGLVQFLLIMGGLYS
jgi:hypothetical protein